AGQGGEQRDCGRSEKAHAARVRRGESLRCPEAVDERKSVHGRDRIVGKPLSDSKRGTYARVDTKHCAATRTDTFVHGCDGGASLARASHFRQDVRITEVLPRSR
ncbi:hypothetical protein, partial [Burkholderia sp. Ac-20379]|uniref:hypothetical protein n=1 Tax=Burkholderia sp. Ac-20379 TaxID=2703900 RepID=UPI001980B6D5